MQRVLPEGKSICWSSKHSKSCPSWHLSAVRSCTFMTNLQTNGRVIWFVASSAHVSKGGEVFLANLLPLVLFSLVPARFFLTLGSFPFEEAKALQIFIKTHSGRGELDNILTVSFAEFLVLLGFDDGQFLLLDPFSVEISLPGNCLFLVDVGHLHALVFVVFFESEGLGFFGLHFNWGFRFFGRLSCQDDISGLAFGSFLNVFVFVELVLEVADVAPSSTFFSGLVTK